MGGRGGAKWAAPQERVVQEASAGADRGWPLSRAAASAREAARRRSWAAMKAALPWCWEEEVEVVKICVVVVEVVIYYC